MQATSFYVQKGWLMSDYQVNIRAQLENFSQIQSQLNTLERNPINIKIKLAPENVDFVNNIQSQFKQAGKSISNQFSTDIGQFTKYKESIDKQTRQSAATTKKWATEYVNNMTAANEKTVANFQNSWKKYYDSNTKMHKQYGEQWQKILNQSATPNISKDEFEDVRKQAAQLKKDVTFDGLNGNTSGYNQLGKGLKQLAQLAISIGVAQKATESISSSLNELKQIDDILTEISKTSDLTDSQLKELGKNSFEEASRWGKKASDYLLGIQEMSRSGYYGKQAEEMANLSVLAQSAGDLTADMANNYLLATNAAYGYNGEVSKLNAVLDGQNMITNRNSVSMEDMSNATSKAASMAAQTGVQIDELSAVIGTSVSRTKQNGNVIGTALKSLLINIQDTSNSKIVDTFESIGISQTKFVNGSEQLKTPIELLRELASAYNSLPEGSTLKTDVLRNIGQKRQANVLAAILGGISSGDFDKMLQDYSDGMGSAAIEAEKSANNWSGSANKLSNAWTKLVSNFANTDVIIDATDSLTGIVKGMDSLIEVSPGLAVAGAAGIAYFVKNFKELAEIGSGVQNLGKVTFGIEELGNAAMGLGKVLASVATNPVTWAVAGISGAIALYDALTVSAKEATAAMEQSTLDYSDADANLTNVSNELLNANQRMGELQAKGTLTFVEKAELENLKATTKELQIQQDLAEKKKNKAGKELAENTATAYEKNYGKEGLSDKTIKQYANTDNNAGLVADEKNLSAMVAGISNFKKLKEEAIKAGDTEEAERLNSIIQEGTDSLFEQVSVLSDYQKKLESVPYKSLSKSAKEDYKQIKDTIDYIYQNFEPEKWKGMKFDEIFSDDKFSGIKSELMSMASSANDAGISIDDLKSKYPDLTTAVADAGLTLEEFTEELNAQALGTTGDGVVSELDKITEEMSAFAQSAGGWITQIDNVNAALISSVSGKGLGFSFEVDKDTGLATLTGDLINVMEAYQDLDGYDPSILFEETANGIHLNREALRQLQAQEEASNKAQFIEKRLALQDELNKKLEQQSKYESDTAEFGTLQADIDAIRENIDTVNLLASAYDGVTSAYNKWINAQSAGEEGDMYDSMRSSYEDVQQMYKDGLVGTNTFRSYVDLLSSQDLSTASVNEIISAYQKLNQTIDGTNYTAIDFLTKGSDGCMNFLNAVQDLNSEWAHMNEDGSWEIDFGVNNDKKVADALGIDVEYLQSIMRKLSDYGFDIKLDSGTASLDELQAKISETEGKLQELGQDPVDINVNASDIDAEIESAKSKIEEINNSDVSPEVKTAQLNDANAKLDALIAKKIEASQPSFMSIDASSVNASVADTLTLLQEYQSAVNNMDTLQFKGADTSEIESAKSKVDELAGKIQSLDADAKVKIGLEADGSIDSIKEQIANNEVKIGVSADTTQAATAISSISGEDVAINVTTSGNETVNGLKASIDSLQDKEVSVGANVVGELLVRTLKSAIDSLCDKMVNVNAVVSGVDAVYALKSAIDSLYSKTVTATTVTKTVRQGDNGAGGADGTAHAQGTAYANGNWGTKESGVALGGELGQELIVRDGKFFTIGDDSAEFFQYKKDDIIFNAEQTKEIFEKGKITHGSKRGKSLAEGTAFSSGSGKFTSGISISANKNSSANGYKSSNSSTSKSSANNNKSNQSSDTDNSFDWIEIWIKRFEEEIDHLTSAMTDIVGNSWKEQNKYIDRMLKLNNEAIKKNREAVNVYMQKANAVGLSDAYKTAVQKGQIKVEDISDENLRKKIEEYQSYYEKRLELDRTYDELVVKNLEYALTRMENIMDDYDKSISKQDSYISMLSAKNDYDEALGKKPNVNNYNGMLATYNETISSLTEEYKLVQEEFNRLVKAGTIKAGTDEYNEWTEKLNGMQEALYNARTEAAKLAEELRSIRWNNWNDNQNILEQAADEVQDVLSMIEDLRNYDDNGNITENGVTKLGLYSIQLENTKKQIAQYDTAIANLDKELKAGLITQDKYNEELADYKDKQRDAQKASKDARDAILDLVKEGINAAIDAYSELIDKRKEALQDDRSFRDHSRKIAEYEKELADIQNQINSYSASGSREDLAKVKELEKQKADIQKEYSEYMEDYQTDKQLEALDKELEDFKEKQEDKITELETSLDAQEVAIRSALETVTDDYTEVYGVLGSLADIYGEKLTETLSKPWQDAKSAYEQYMNAVKGINEFSGSGTVTTDKYTVSKNSSGKTTIIDNATGQGKAGWTKIGNDWYYADSSGVAQGNQWVKSGGKWYHTDASGKMQTGWVKDKDKWYYLDESGAMVTGWKKVKNKWYYLNDDGSMATGWKKVGGEWYFMNDDGSMKSSEWVKHKDKWYYLQQGGAMAKNAYVKDKKKDLYYWVNKDGEWEPKWNTSTPDLKKYKLAYANGTMNSAPGWKWINEDGIELVRTASGDLLYTKGGDTVFTNPMTQNLAEFSKSPEAFIRDYLPKFELLNIPQKDIANNIIVESPQLIIQGNVDNSTLPKIEKMINEKINDFTKQLSNNTKLHGATSNANRIR